jgi:tRNA-dihydrouridine synthase
MSTNFWQALPKPFFILAPMDDVTDSSFRRIVAEAAAPDIFFTEFGNATGFQSPGRDRVGEKFYFDEVELAHPLVAQIWGNVPADYEQTARDLASRGFAGIDINMGCPEKNIVARGCCAGLIDNHTLAGEIIATTKRGAGDLPVSVKTRIGVKTIDTEAWISFLLEQDLAALTVHGRTAKEMSKVPVHWDEIAKAVTLRNKIAPQTLIMGNGDILTREDGLKLAAEYGLDGIMMGRAIFHNPWVFATEQIDHTPAERLTILHRHLELHEALWAGRKRYEPLKKFFKIYIQSFPGASDLRMQLMETKTYAEAYVVLADYEQTRP